MLDVIAVENPFVRLWNNAAVELCSPLSGGKNGKLGIIGLMTKQRETRTTRQRNIII